MRGTRSAVPGAGAVLAERLRERTGEIEAALAARLRGIADPAEVADPAYALGLREAISAALEYGIEAIEGSERRPPEVPLALLGQARLAARNKISLDTVQRRYFAGYTLLGDFVIDDVGLRRASDLKRLLRLLSASFDRLLATVSEEYSRERESWARSSEQRRAEQIERLLAGELLDHSELGYELDARHLGAIAKGPGAMDALRVLARSLDRRLLALERGGEAVWAWLGGRAPLEPKDVRLIVAAEWPSRVRLAVGEPGEGPGGWRLTHQQARAALSVALRSPEPFVRYADVAMLASILQDDLLATSLRELYLKPLEAERDGGETLRETLRAYFACGRNVSSAAAMLGVSRQAVNSRLRSVEGTLGQPLGACAVEVEAALHMNEIDSPFRSLDDL